MKNLPTFSIPYEVGMAATTNDIPKLFLNDFERQLIKDTFKQCYGLKSCLKSVRTQGDAIVSLSERTGLRIEFIKNNLEQIINL